MSDGTAQPTLEAVAERAGVSRATVSRVINANSRVSALARRAVEQAIEELGYVPNRAARSLVTRRTDSIALVVTEPADRLFSDPFFAGVTRGVAHALAEQDLQLVLLMRQSGPGERRLERYLSSSHIDGALIVSLHGRDPLPALLAAQGVPVVLAGRPQDGEGLPYVDVDNVGGARAAVTHLLERGRGRIATITGPLDMAAGQDRLVGYREALERAGLEADDSLEEAGWFDEASGAQAMRALLDRRGDIDALFAASDLMAAGALAVLHERGRAVPDDVAVVSFDDTFVARSCQPPLTSVRQPIEELGGAATRLLIAHIRGEPAAGRVLLDTELVVRAST